MRKILITVNADGRVTTDVKQLGYSGEHNAAEMSVTFLKCDDIISAVDYFRIIIDGRYSDDLYLADGMLTYSVPQVCMCPPRVQCQVVGYKIGHEAPEIIVKSQVFSFDVDRSQVAAQVAENTPDVFEKALDACRKASEYAVTASSAVAQAKNAAGLSAQHMAQADLAAEWAKRSADSAAESAEVVAQTEYDLNNIANALKGTASGSVCMRIDDTSPLEHTMTVNASGDIPTGEVLTKTQSVSAQGDTVSLDEPAATVRIVMVGQVHTVSGLIPLVDGDDLTALESFDGLAIVPQGMYDECYATYDLTYTVSGNVLSWTGTKTLDETVDGTVTEVSGSYTLSSSGQKITGFYQVYALDESNPYYLLPEYDTLLVDVSLYEGESVTVTTYGKNLVDWSNADKWVACPWKTGTKAYPIPTTAGQTYTVSWGYENQIPSFFYLVIRNENKATNNEKPFTYDNVRNKTHTFTAGEGYTYWLHCASGGNNFSSWLPLFAFIQVEAGTTATEYVPYQEPTTYKADSGGNVDGVRSMYPTTTLIPSVSTAELSIGYNRDINKAFAELQAAVISMGGNV